MHTCVPGVAHVHAAVAVAIVSDRFVDRQAASGVISPKFGALLHSFFFARREREISLVTMAGQILLRVFDLKGHPSSRRCMLVLRKASNIIIMSSARPLCDAINARDETPARFGGGLRRRRV